MEVKCQYETIAKCHPSDVWETFKNIEQWRNHSPVFGDAGWVHGEPWKQGSRFFIELMFPQRIDVEAVVLKCNAPHEMVIICHGAGFAGEQWIRFDAYGSHQTTISTDEAIVGAALNDEAEIQRVMCGFFTSWFDGLKDAAEKHCETVAL
jgi:hypothetical protein